MFSRWSAADKKLSQGHKKAQLRWLYNNRLQGDLNKSIASQYIDAYIGGGGCDNFEI